MRPGARSDEWVELGRTRWWMPLIGYSPIMLLLPVYTLNLSGIFWPDLPLGWSIAVMLAMAGGSFGIIVAISRLINPRAFVKPAASMVRAGRKQAGYSEITSAQLFPGVSKGHPSLLLLLRAENKLRTPILLRDRKQRVLEPKIAALVLDLVRQSNIAMPVSPDDPRGRFARFNFPNNITKDEAVELVAHPPESVDKLPIPYVWAQPK
jgi:hypothetical protein